MMSFLLLASVSTAWSEPPSTVLEQARAILKASKSAENGRDGRTVIQMLTVGRKVESLSRAELIALATACNWAGEKSQQLHAADLMLKKNPADEEAWDWKANALYNLAFGKRTTDSWRKQEIAFYEDCARRNRDKGYWLLRKAVALCQGSLETRVNIRGIVETDVVTDKDAFEKAFVTLHEALTVNSKLREGRGAIYLGDFLGSSHFPRLYGERRFGELLKGTYKGS